MKAFNYKQEIVLQVTVFMCVIGCFIWAVWAIDTGVIKSEYQAKPLYEYTVKYTEYPSYERKTIIVKSTCTPSQIQVNPNLPDNGIRVWDENGHRNIVNQGHVFSIESITEK